MDMLNTALAACDHLGAPNRGSRAAVVTVVTPKAKVTQTAVAVILCLGHPRGTITAVVAQTVSLPRSQSAKFVKKSQVFSRTFNPIWRVGPHSMAWGGQAAGESAEGTRHIASPCLDKLAHPIALVTARLSNRQHALESREMSERCN